MKRILLALFLWLILILPLKAQGPIVHLPIVFGDDCMGFAKLAISDGTTEISLLDLTGIHLAEDGWTPKIIKAKGGGVFQDSSMAAGRRLVYRQLGTAQEEFTFNIMGLTQDELAANTADLLQLLEKAVNYWESDWQDDVVYLIAQSDCETYARYAPILYYEAPELQNPYEQPFIMIDGAIYDDVGVMIERGHWQDVPPGEKTCVEDSSVQEWNIDEMLVLRDANPTVIYDFLETTTGRVLGGEFGDIYSSDDAGDTWINLSAFPAGAVMDLMQSTTGRIFAADNGQVIYSDNNGANWNVSVGTVGQACSLLQTRTGRILAGESYRIRYTDNDGGAWNTITFTSAWNIYTLLQTTTGRILAGAHGHIYYSDDDGLTWNTAYTSYGYVYTMIQTLSGKIIAGHEDGILFISEDDGVSWYMMQLPPVLSNAHELLQDSNGRIWAGLGSYIYYSDDDGLSWQYYAEPNPVADVHAIYEISTGRILIGVDAIYSLGPLTTCDMGADATCTDIVYVASKQNVANLTDIYVDDGGGWGGNLLPMTVFPVDLLPGAPIVNDAVYFGINTSVYDSGPFSSLVFDLIPIEFSNTYTISWEYFNGGWVALTVHDGTDPGTGSFGNLGVNSVHWVPPADWTTRDISLDGGPAVTGYWVRARVSALVGNMTNPSQQNRNVYTVVNGYVNVANTEVLGDIAALSQVKAHNRSDRDGRGSYGPNLFDNRLVVGLRSYDRGEDFQAYINISDEQNPFGIVVTDTGANCTFGNSIVAPSGRNATYNPAGVEAMATQVTIEFGPTIAQDYYGVFHAFLRVYRTAGASTDFDIQLVIITGSGGIQKTTEIRQVQTTDEFELLDFGQVVIPVGGGLAQSDLGDQFHILIQASAANGTPNLEFYDLVLMPVDEWAIDSVDMTNSSDSIVGRDDAIDKLLDIDSVTDPRNPIKSLVRQVGSEFVSANYNSITNGPAILQASAQQRLWFLVAKTSATGSSYSWISRPEMVHSIQIYRAQRYFGLRGNR